MVENTNISARFDSTRLVIVVIDQNIGIRLKVEPNNSGSFFIGSYTNIFRSGAFLSNSEARSSYSPNLDQNINLITLLGSCNRSKAVLYFQDSNLDVQTLIERILRLKAMVRDANRRSKHPIDLDELLEMTVDNESAAR